MYIAPKSISPPKSPVIQYWPKNETLFNGGLNLVDKEYKIQDNQTAKTLNMWWYKGELGKRWGQDYLLSSESVETPGLSTYEYLYKGMIVKHCGTKLYMQDPLTGTVTAIYSGLPKIKGSFFKFNNILYYKTMGKYVQWNGPYVNLIGTAGDCEVTTNFAAISSTLALSTTKKFGTYCVEATSTANSGTFGAKSNANLIYISPSKYYLVTAYIRMTGATNVRLKVLNYSDTLIGQTMLTTNTLLTSVGVVLQPSDLTGQTQIKVQLEATSNAIGNKCAIDGIMVNEINSDEYNAGAYSIMGSYPFQTSINATNVVPYEPTVLINQSYSGGGDVNESYNRLGSAVINSFITDNSHTVFPLSDTNLDTTACVGSVDGGITWTLSEGTNFTINRTANPATVTYTATPPALTNKYQIKFYKTDQAQISSILNCLDAIPFGGTNDNRVFAGRNGSGNVYWTGITSVGVDPTYWPVNNYNPIGLTDETITGMGKQYETLCIFKEREIAGCTYTFNGTTGIFNWFSVNSQIGYDLPDTLQTVNNQLTWCNSYLGGFTLVGTAVQSQRNVKPITRNINPRLLSESNLKNANSVNFDGKYWLCIDDKVYLWDYTISPYSDLGNDDESAKRLSWWYFDNINAQSWIMDGQDLYYITRDTGKTVKFHRAYDTTQFFDFGGAFNSIYRIPIRDFGDSIYEFDVIDMWVDVRGDTRTDINVLYITSDDINGEAEAPLGDSEPISVGSFSLTDFSLLFFTLQVMGYKTTFNLRPLEKKIDIFGVEFSNNDAGRDMNISNVVISYVLGKRKK